ncbi:MAG TPA: hypothetical protein VK761_09100 [Solirubrobacteraceae bacterium]|jgi:hypothetical protein|nr:hypothetical protein [Solirubrobacteraceae bacterium]
MRARLLTAVAAAAVAASVAGVAAADTVKLPPIAKTYKAPAKSPVAFAKVRSAQGSVKSLAKGTPLKAGQTVELIVGKGNVVMAPRDCACQGLGLVQPKGQKLASVFVEARSAAGKTLAVAPAKKLFIEGNGGGGLPVGFTYEFAPGTKAFPKGSQLVTFALFSK